MPVKKKLKSIRSLQRKAERLWKEICLKRDGRECQIKKNFPEVKTKHSEVYQVDHCFWRSDKNLFLEPSNGTVICSNCNLQKSFGHRAIDKLVDQIVRKREGEEKYNKMILVSTTADKNELFTNREWLEDKINELTSILEQQKEVTDGSKNLDT